MLRGQLWMVIPHCQPAVDHSWHKIALRPKKIENGAQLLENISLLIISVKIERWQLKTYLANLDWTLYPHNVSPFLWRKEYTYMVLAYMYVQKIWIHESHQNTSCYRGAIKLRYHNITITCDPNSKIHRPTILELILMNDVMMVFHIYN